MQSMSSSLDINLVQTFLFPNKFLPFECWSPGEVKELLDTSVEEEREMVRE
jgi:hypothetical protein